MAQENIWTERQLAQLQVKGDFRLRGLEMTRLETFADAAFAFAVTMLVISIDTIPGNLSELIEALKGAPAFAASFATIMSFWSGHNRWSRHYGLEDGITIFLTLCLIFIVLLFLYPLKLVFSALFSWVTGGWIPSQFEISSQREMADLFIVYGLGFAAIALIIALLDARAWSKRMNLHLDDAEQLRTREDIITWTLMCGTGALSAMFAWITPAGIGVYAGFIYFILPISMPILAIRYDRRVRALQPR